MRMVERPSDRPWRERFLELVDKRGPDECWPWKGRRDASGYGIFAKDRKNWRASRVAWEFANDQPFPEGLFACHTCDNPPCVNPAHLWPGTAKENSHDARAKGRLRRGPIPTHCVRGHALVGDNLYSHRPWNACRQCAVVYRQQYRDRKRAKALREAVRKGESVEARIEREAIVAWLTTEGVGLPIFDDSLTALAEAIGRGDHLATLESPTA